MTPIITYPDTAACRRALRGGAARPPAVITGLMIEACASTSSATPPADERVTLDALAGNPRSALGELLDELATDATDWLNGEVAATDHSFAWSGGDFLYQPDNPTERG